MNGDTKLKIKVLLVDDHPLVLAGVRSSLLKYDRFEVVGEASSGPEAISRAKDSAPDVVVMDVMMPRLDGWETAVQLRKSPQTAHIRVVLITARAQEDDKNRGDGVGADAYLTKPFDPNEMIRVVRELASATPLR